MDIIEITSSIIFGLNISILTFEILEFTIRNKDLEYIFSMEDYIYARMTYLVEHVKRQTTVE